MKFNYGLEIKLKKEEILQTIARYDSALKFLITTFIAIVGVGLHLKSIMVTMLAYICIFFAGGKVYHWLDLMTKHGAYKIVFLENSKSKFYWETINHESVLRSKAKGIEIIKNLEILWLIWTNFLVIFYIYFGKYGWPPFPVKAFDLEEIKKFSDTLNLDTLLFYISIGLTLILSIYFLREANSASEGRERWINVFEEMKIDLPVILNCRQNEVRRVSPKKNRQYRRSHSLVRKLPPTTPRRTPPSR